MNARILAFFWQLIEVPYRELKDESAWQYPPLEPIISWKQWIEVQSLLAGSPKTRKTKRSAGVFSEVLRCHCGSGMYHPRGRKMYFCRRCDNRIEVEILTSILLDQLSNYRADDPRLSVSELEKTQTKETLLAAQENTELELEELNNRYLADGLTKPEFHTLTNPLYERLAGIEEELARLNNHTVDDSLDALWPTFTESSQQQLLGTIFNKVTIGISSVDINLALPSSLS